MAKASEPIREHLTKLVNDHGVEAVAAAYQLAAVTVLRLMSGQPVRRSTLRVVELLSKPENAPQQAQAIAAYPGGKPQGDDE